MDSLQEIEPITRDSVIQKSADAICRLIQARGLQPGDALPSETVISEMLRVSRNSVRESLRMLDALGFVEKRPSRGVVVKAALGSAQSHDMASPEILAALATAAEVRELIEIRCVELAVDVATEDDLERLRESLVTFESAMKQGDVFSAARSHLAFHDAVVMSARNNLLNAMYQQVRFMIADIGAIGSTELLLEREHFDGHWQIYLTIKEQNPKAVTAAIKQHYRIVGPLRRAIVKNSVIDSRKRKPPMS